MKKSLLIVMLMLLAINLNAQKQIFEAPDLKAKIAAQRTVAIIPFQVTINMMRKVSRNFPYGE